MSEGEAANIVSMRNAFRGALGAAAVGISLVACSGEDDTASGSGQGVGSGARAGAAGDGSLLVGGRGGKAGAAGVGGQAGAVAGGQAGAGGGDAAGMGGAAGTGGQGGSANAGSGGASGEAGASAGASGSAGATSGAGGVAGGAAGSSAGEAGSAGSTSGAAGSTSGAAGSAGSSGAAGDAGSSGAGGDAGASGAGGTGAGGAGAGGAGAGGAAGDGGAAGGGGAAGSAGGGLALNVPNIPVDPLDGQLGTDVGCPLQAAGSVPAGPFERTTSTQFEARTGRVGGCYAERVCPVGSAVVGYRARQHGPYYGSTLSKLVPKCAPLAVEGSNVVVGTPFELLPELGGAMPSGGNVTSDCPANTIVAYAAVRQAASGQERYVGDLVLFCAQATVDAGGVVTTGTPQAIATAGVNATDPPYGYVGCPSGQVLDGLTAGAGDIANRVGAWCHVLTSKP